MKNKILYIASLFTIAMMSGGCFFFATKNIFNKSNYEIVKLEIDNLVLFSPQELANQAKSKIYTGNDDNKQNINLDNDFFLNPYEKAKRNKKASNNDVNFAFEQLRLRNQNNEESEQTSLSELAKISLKSTFNLDKTQGILYGMIGCNNYTAKFFWQDSMRIVVSGGASTRKLCYPKEVSEFQNNFVHNMDGIYTITKLRNRKGYVLNNGRMRIYLK